MYQVYENLYNFCEHFATDLFFYYSFLFYQPYSVDDLYFIQHFFLLFSLWVIHFRPAVQFTIYLYIRFVFIVSRTAIKIFGTLFTKEKIIQKFFYSQRIVCVFVFSFSLFLSCTHTHALSLVFRMTLFATISIFSSKGSYRLNKID